MSGFRIRTLTAWVLIDQDDDESLPGIASSSGEWIPFVGADNARIESFRPIVQQIASSIGRPIKLVRFTVREELEVIEPKPKE